MLFSDKRSVSNQGLYDVEGRCLCVRRFDVIKHTQLKRVSVVIHFVVNSLFSVKRNSYWMKIRRAALLVQPFSMNDLLSGGNITVEWNGLPVITGYHNRGRTVIKNTHVKLTRVLHIFWCNGYIPATFFSNSYWILKIGWSKTQWSLRWVEWRCICPPEIRQIAKNGIFWNTQVVIAGKLSGGACSGQGTLRLKNIVLGLYNAFYLCFFVFLV